jgi:hypothetical protein
MERISICHFAFDGLHRAGLLNKKGEGAVVQEGKTDQLHYNYVCFDERPRIGDSALANTRFNGGFFGLHEINRFIETAFQIHQQA